MGGNIVPHPGDRLEQTLQQLASLQAAQTDGVGRTDIDGKIISQRHEPPEQQDIITGSLFERRVLIFPNIDTHDQILWPFLL